MARVGQLVFEMAADVARLQSDMAKARGTVDGAMSGIKSAANTARNALAAIGVGLSVHAFAEMIKGSVEAMNTLHELAIKTGNTVEALSELRPVARASGTDMEQLAVGMQKLSKSMYEVAETGKGKAAGAFETLGISVVDASGKLRGNNEVMKEVAEKLEAMENKTQAVALAQQIFGKAGAQLLPFLHELAEAGALHASVTTEQAEAAHRFHVQLGQLTARSDGLKREMTLGLLPALSQIAGAMLDMNGQGAEVRSFFEAVGTLLKWVTEGAMSFWLALKDMGDSLGALAAQAAALLSGDLEMFKTIGRERDAQAKRNEEEFEKFKQRMGEIPAIAAKAKSGVLDAMEVADYLDEMEQKTGGKRGGAGGRASGGGVVGSNTLSGDGNAGGGIASGGTVGAVAAVATQVKQLNSQLADTSRTTSDVDKLFENAAVKAIRNFKNLRGVVSELAADLLRMGARSLTSSLGLGTGGGGDSLSGIAVDVVRGMFGGGRAAGGGVNAGTSYMVGEDGPELFTPGQSGGITPNGALRGGGGNVYNNFVIDARGADAAGMARLEARIAAMDGSLERRAVNAVGRYSASRGMATAMG